MLCSCKLRLRRASPTVGLPGGHRALLGLRRLHAGGAKTGSYKGHVAGLFFFLRRTAAEEKNGLGQIARTTTITEWPPKWFLKLSAADRPLRCMVLFWLFFVLVLSEAVLVLVLVLDRSIVRLYHSILFNALLRREFSNG
jgi:hypothetical protein